MADIWKQLDQLAKDKLIPAKIKMFAHPSAELTEPLLQQAHKFAVRYPHITIQFRTEHDHLFDKEDVNPAMEVIDLSVLFCKGFFWFSLLFIL
ncbi:hypothetical protein T439DRAFT_150210 [Meredithblackwellia eburnea MCA 4105]